MYWALFCEKNVFNMVVNGRGLGRFSFRPKSPQKGRGHLKHDFRLTEWLLPDSTMTYKSRSDGLVLESDRKKSITFKCRHLRDLQGYCVYTSWVFFFFSSSFPISPRKCVAPIAHMDKPPLRRTVTPFHIFVNMLIFSWFWDIRASVRTATQEDVCRQHRLPLLTVSCH